MLQTPHYIQNEMQIHWNGSQGPHDVVPIFPLSFHTVFSSKQICIPLLVTSNSLLFTTLGLHAFNIPFACSAALCPLTCLCNSSMGSLFTLPPHPGGDV